MSHKFEMTFDQAVLVHKIIDERTQALKNWIASAIECDQPGRAKTLVAELREYEKLYAAFNLRAKQETSQYTGKPMKTEHFVR